jgi:DNA sulfur modification protein DndE
MIQLSNIRTSAENKEIVAELTRKLELGTENVIARLAIGYSLGKERKLNLRSVKDSKGKEYSKTVLFGNYYPLYVSMICVAYSVHSSDKDIPKYLKLHLDDGIELINDEYRNNPGLTAIDFLVDKVEQGLTRLAPQP